LSDLADALDHAEFIERVPALQREAATVAKAVVGRMTAYGRSYYDDEFRGDPGPPTTAEQAKAQTTKANARRALSCSLSVFVLMSRPIGHQFKLCLCARQCLVDRPAIDQGPSDAWFGARVAASSCER